MESSSANIRPVALVTGGTSGIGAAICRRLAQDGCAIIVNYYRNAQDAADLVDEIGGHSRALAVQADVSVDADVQHMVDAAIESFGRIDILVNNASFSSAELWNADPLKIPLDQWQRSLDVDLTGAYLCARHVIPHMARGGRGKILNFSSSGSLQGDIDTFAYNAAKTGVVALAKGLAKAFAPAIQVYAIAPGSIDSGWIERWNLTGQEIAGLKATSTRERSPVVRT